MFETIDGDSLFLKRLSTWQLPKKQNLLKDINGNLPLILLQYSISFITMGTLYLSLLSFEVFVALPAPAHLCSICGIDLKEKKKIDWSFSCLKRNICISEGSW